MRSIVGCVLALFVVLSGNSLLPADERDSSVTAAADAPIILVEMPDRGRQAWMFLPSPLGTFILPDHVQLGPDGTSITRFLDSATAVNIRGRAKQLETLIRIGGGDPIHGSVSGALEVNEPLLEKTTTSGPRPSVGWAEATAVGGLFPPPVYLMRRSWPKLMAT